MVLDAWSDLVSLAARLWALTQSTFFALRPSITARNFRGPILWYESSPVGGGTHSFVGRFGDQKYELGSTEAGLARAIRRMRELRGEIQAKVA